MVEKFSTWIFESNITMDEIETKLREFCNDVEGRISGRKISEVERSVVNVDGENVDYIFGNAYCQHLKNRWENLPEEKQIDINEEKFIIYKDEKNIKLVILGSKSKSKTIISRVFKKDFGSIVEENYIVKDLLYWFVYRVREFKDKEAMVGSELYFRGLEGYMGKTTDNVNSFRAQGFRVMALMNTLAFIFNDEDLRSLRPKLQYKDMILVVEFSSNNSNKIISKKEELSISDKILVCKVILPKLVKAYNEAKKNRQWSLEIKLTFLRGIGNEIGDKVDTQLLKIEKQIKKLVDESDGCEEYEVLSFDEDDDVEFDEDDEVED